MLKDLLYFDVSEWLASLFRKRVTPAELHARYKEILAAILPDRYLTPDGLLRRPTGVGEEVQFEVRNHITQYGSMLRQAFVENTIDRALNRHLRLHRDVLGQELVMDIERFATAHFCGNTPTRIVLCDVTDGIFLHEVFHDIQAFLYDYHPDVHECLLNVVRDRKKDIEELYATGWMEVMPGVVVYHESCRWMAGYSLEQLFPSSAVRSPYYGVFTKVNERFGWRTLFKIEAVTDAASIEMAHQEVIPTLLTGFACGDNRVIPVLHRIFKAGALNEDFDKRLHSSTHALRTSSVTRSAVKRPSAAKTANIELPSETIFVHNETVCKLLPSLPGSRDPPKHRPKSAWRCPKCGTSGAHWVLTNIVTGPDDAFTKLFAASWRKRACAVDALVCPRQGEHLQYSAFPLYLSDATISDLIRLCTSCRLRGRFDGAEITALRIINARPAEAEPRLLYVNVLLDRLKFTRLLGKSDPHDHANNREACTRLAGEVLEAARSLKRADERSLLVSTARLALETGDVAAATRLLGEARACASKGAADDESDTTEKDVRDFNGLPA